MHPTPRSRAREFFFGVGYLGRGLKMWISNPRIMLLGAIPALIVGVVYVGCLVALVLNFDALVTLLTPWAESLDAPARTLARIGIGVGVVGISVLLVVYTFVAVTLTVGDPFYERVWRRTEELLGDAPDGAGSGFWASVGDGLRLFFATVLLGLCGLAIGLIPLVGPVLATILGAAFGGWFLALELSTRAFEERGIPGRDRRRILGSNRPRAVGFGVATYLLFLVPFLAVVVMPAAVAGATMLSRDALRDAGLPLQAERPKRAVTPGE